MHLPLLLTESEQALLGALPAGLRAACPLEVTDETLINYSETPEQIRYRLTAAAGYDSPATRGVLAGIQEKLDEGAVLTGVDFSGLTGADFDHFCSALGARGMTAFIETGLTTAASAEDLQSIAYLSHIRHGLLKSNQSFFSSKSP